MKYIKIFEDFVSERKNTPKPKGAPDWHDSDAPDAEGRFRDLSPKELAKWLIKTRDGDLKRISGSLTQQIVFRRKRDPEYADKMEKTRIEVYKQLGREDLIDKMDESVKFDTKSTGRDDWDKDLKKSGDIFTQFEVNMSPDEFLKRVQADRFKQDPAKIKKYASQFKRGAKDVPTPTMWFMNKFQWESGLAPSFHDGSHRVLALKEIGVKEIPVKIIYQ